MDIKLLIELLLGISTMTLYAAFTRIEYFIMLVLIPAVFATCLFIFKKNAFLSIIPSCIVYIIYYIINSSEKKFYTALLFILTALPSIVLIILLTYIVLRVIRYIVLKNRVDKSTTKNDE